MEQKSKTYIRPIVIVMIFAFITIGYAYLTSVLNINGSTLIKNPTWDVHFENIQVKDGSVIGDQVIQAPEIDTDRTTVSFHVNLKKPGDYYEFTVDAVNAGTIDAMINTFTNLELTEAQQTYLESSVTYEDGEEIQQHQQLLAGDTAVYKVRIAYKLDLEADDLPSNPEQLDLEFSVDFVQRDDTAIGRRAENSFYNILKNEGNTGLYVSKYYGSHQDSMDPSQSNKDIYYWRASSNYNASLIQDRWNVLFADHCWQMLRTTDTGGVKMIYNGEADNGQCLNTRGNHVGYGARYGLNLSSSHWFGTDYTYDNTTNTFKLSGELDEGVWTTDTWEDLIGKYTCNSTDPDATCSTLYLVAAYYSATSASTIPLNSETHYSQIGKTQYNLGEKTPSHVGYMYGDVYSSTYLSMSSTINKYNNYGFLSSRSMPTQMVYSDSVRYNVQQGGSKYILQNSQTITSSDDLSVLIGKYTFFTTSTSNSYTVYYIGDVVDNTIYYLTLSYGSFADSVTPFIIGDSITDNNDGTYSINNPQTVTLQDWRNNYEDYLNKYLCINSSSCTNPRYIVLTMAGRYDYVDAGDRIVLGKGYNGLQLTDTINVGMDYLYNTSYDDLEHIYTCGNTQSVCTDSNFKVIFKIYKSKFEFYYYCYSNYIVGSSVVWDGSKYTLVDPQNVEYIFHYNKAANYHYFCGVGVKECTSVKYLLYYNTANSTTNHSLYYMSLSNGVSSIEELMNNMFNKNINDSLVKSGIDSWYKKELLDYDSYIEDTIFCNDRYNLDYGAWNSNGGPIKGNGISLSFGGKNISSAKLACSSEYDSFSTQNSKAKLIYKVGLPTISDLILLGNNNLRSTGQYYWTMSANTFSVSSNFGAGMRVVESDGNIPTNIGAVYSTNMGIRPVISLKRGTFFVSGDGSMENPYVVYTG